MTDNRFRTQFAKQHTFLPVVHADKLNQVLRNISVAKENGADGVFLINHDVSFSRLMEMYTTATTEFPNFWIGLNFLELHPLGAFRIANFPSTLQGLWTDNAHTARAEGSLVEAMVFLHERTLRRWEGIFFGGVEFKGQSHSDNPAAAAADAVPYVDIITTSGDRTGSPPSVEKIKSMKQSIDNFPLAIASGMTPENVHEYLPYADCFLVASGISHSFTELNPNLVRQFADKLEHAVAT